MKHAHNPRPFPDPGKQTLSWLFDSRGAALRLTPEVVGFNVRYWPPGARGPGEQVLDDAGPLPVPLFVYRDTPPADVAEQLGDRYGRFRFDAVDAEGQLVEGVPAGEIRRDPPSPPAVPNPPSQAPGADAVLGVLMELVKSMQGQLAAQQGHFAGQLHAQGEQFVQQLGAINQQIASDRRAQTEQVAALIAQNSSVMRAGAELIVAADGAGLSRRKAPPLIVEALAAEPRNGDGDGDGDGDLAIVKEIVAASKPFFSFLTARFGPRPPEPPANGNATPAPSSTPLPAAPPVDVPTAARGGAGVAASPPGAATPDRDHMMAHLAAMGECLTAAEVAQAMTVMQSMPAAECDRWTSRLLSLPPADAAALVRRALAQGPRDPSTAQR